MRPTTKLLLRRIIKEEVRRALKENKTKTQLNEDTNAAMMMLAALLPVMGVAAGARIGTYLGSISDYDDRGIVDRVKDWWKGLKNDRILNKIADRIKDDPEVQQFVKNPRKKGWQKMLASKLTPEEQKYVTSLFRSRFEKRMKP